MSTKRVQDTKILLVDDEPAFREVLAFSFRRLGYQVLSAANGREAFDLIQSEPVDVVISDIRMPGGDGVELLDRTKEMSPETPIVLLVTGFADLTTEEAHNKGAEALFSKPFDRKSMQETIVRLLTSPEERWASVTDRIDVDLRATLQLDSLPKAIESRTVNIGRGGMFVTVPEDTYLNVNDTLSFQINLDGNSTQLKGSGIVKWVRTKNAPNFPAGCGIEFTYLDEIVRQRIIELVNSEKPKAYIPNR